MVGIVLILVICLLGIFLIFTFIKYQFIKRYVLNNFKTCNVIVAGKKGRGKDLIFQYVINHRKDYYYSNISYGHKHKIVSLKDVSCEPNNYLKLINNDVVKQPHKFKDGKDIYLSDIGNFLPSYMDSTLYKLFPSMPLYYSLSRHLYNNNVHCNTQNIERGWKALREQADFFMVVKSTIKIFNFIFITKFNTYERYESAKQNLLPIKTRFLNKFSKANVDLYNAQNGVIKSGFFIQFKPQLKYDTRAFEKILLKGTRKK